jgi:hypothetical protein
MLDILIFFDNLLDIVFFFTPKPLVLYAFSLFIVTIGRTLTYRGGIYNRILKYCLLLFYFIMAVHRAGIFFLIFEGNLTGMNLFELISLLMPTICVFLLMVIIRRKKFPGTSRKIINFGVMWVGFISLCLLALYTIPQDIIFELNLLYAAVMFMILIFGGRNAGGGRF